MLAMLQIMGWGWPTDSNSRLLPKAETPNAHALGLSLLGGEHHLPYRSSRPRGSKEALKSYPNIPHPRGTSGPFSCSPQVVCPAPQKPGVNLIPCG